jgi:hypothetical protein
MWYARDIFAAAITRNLAGSVVPKGGDALMRRKNTGEWGRGGVTVVLLGGGGIAGESGPSVG